MTNEILRSDIDLAKRLLITGSPDEEICSALARRGIDREAATQLLSDLRCGRMVQPTREFFPVMPPGPTPAEPAMAPRSTSVHTAQAPTVSATPGTSPSRPWKLWFSAAVLLCLGAGALVLALQSRFRHPPPRSGSSPSVPNLTLGPNGLRLNTSLSGEGSLLTREGSYDVLAALLGAPTRTNHTEVQTIYAFDRQGLLLYVQPDRTAAWLVVDFAGQGEDNGAEAPFAGSLTLHDVVIQADTERHALADNQALGLTNAASDTLAGGAGGVHLTFDFSKPRERISTVIIDWK